VGAESLRLVQSLVQGVLGTKPAMHLFELNLCLSSVCTVAVSESDTPESRRRMLSDSDSDISDIPPELPPRTPSRTLSNAVCTTSTNGETRSSRTTSVVSTDNNLTAFVADPWTNGTYCLALHLCMLFSCLKCFDVVGWVAGRASGL